MSGDSLCYSTIACVITDKDLNELDRGQWVISGFAKEFLEGLPYFHQKNFRDSAVGVGAFEPIKDDRSGRGADSDITDVHRGQLLHRGQYHLRP